MDKSTHQIRCEQWSRIIEECLASGMFKTSWCKANGFLNFSVVIRIRKPKNQSFCNSLFLSLVLMVYRVLLCTQYPKK